MEFCVRLARTALHRQPGSPAFAPISQGVLERAANSGLLHLASGLQTPISPSWRGQSQKVSGRCRKYSRFQETAAGDSRKRTSAELIEMSALGRKPKWAGFIRAARFSEDPQSSASLLSRCGAARDDRPARGGGAEAAGEDTGGRTSQRSASCSNACGRLLRL